uniref:Ig-like domain-containing protein n=1 Tax=Clastoptera arizonana TaxID=38151 RepID=A0A1B6DCB5_9HEMI
MYLVRVTGTTKGMASWPLSKTLSVLGLVMLVHLVVMTSLADRGQEFEGATRTRRNLENQNHKNPENGITTSQAYPHGAVFVTENSTVVTAQVGSTATLPCVVRKFGSGVVSWIRRKDYHLLTVGRATYSSDERFLVEHARHLQNWGLQIKFIQSRDAGMYECQVSTHPAASILVELRVIEAAAEILGSPDLHIKSGSTMRLVCELHQSTETPMFVFWYHGPRMINYDKDRGISVVSDKRNSVLTLSVAEKNDSGNYTCVPSNVKPASINVHVLNGEKPAAMQHGGRNSASNHPQLSICYICILLIFIRIIR